MPHSRSLALLGFFSLLGCSVGTSGPDAEDPLIATDRLPAAWTGVPSEFVLETNLADSSDFWTIVSGSLPLGLLLHRSGKISGQMAAEEVFSFSAQVLRGAGGGTAEREFTLHACGEVPNLEPGGTLKVEFPAPWGVMLIEGPDDRGHRAGYRRIISEPIGRVCGGGVPRGRCDRRHPQALVSVLRFC